MIGFGCASTFLHARATTDLALDDLQERAGGASATVKLGGSAESISYAWRPESASCAGLQRRPRGLPPMDRALWNDTIAGLGELGADTGLRRAMKRAAGPHPVRALRRVGGRLRQRGASR